MTAKKTSESANDFRLWLTPMLVVIETVNRLAMSVNTRSTSQASKPAVVSSGSVTVEISAKQISKTASVVMLMNSIGLDHFLVFVIGLISNPGVMEIPRMSSVELRAQLCLFVWNLDEETAGMFGVYQHCLARP